MRQNDIASIDIILLSIDDNSMGVVWRVGRVSIHSYRFVFLLTGTGIPTRILINRSEPRERSDRGEEHSSQVR